MSIHSSRGTARVTLCTFNGTMVTGTTGMDTPGADLPYDPLEVQMPLLIMKATKMSGVGINEPRGVQSRACGCSCLPLVASQMVFKL